MAIDGLSSLCQGQGDLGFGALGIQGLGFRGLDLGVGLKGVWSRV